MSEHLTFLGILSAPTQDGKRAVAIALAGAVELYHFVDAGLDTSSDLVCDWLWAASINPDEAAVALPPHILINDIILPALTGKTLVVCHSDANLEFVDLLVNELQSKGSMVITSGINLTGPIARLSSGAAGRRAFALQANYEAALDDALGTPAPHIISGECDDDGDLSVISVAGVFLQQSWAIIDELDVFSVLTCIMQIGPRADIQIETNQAGLKIRALAAQFGISIQHAA